MNLYNFFTIHEKINLKYIKAYLNWDFRSDVAQIIVLKLSSLWGKYTFYSRSIFFFFFNISFNCTICVLFDYSTKVVLTTKLFWSIFSHLVWKLCSETLQFNCDNLLYFFVLFYLFSFVIYLFIYLFSHTYLLIYFEIVNMWNI